MASTTRVPVNLLILSPAEDEVVAYPTYIRSASVDAVLTLSAQMAIVSEALVDVIVVVPV